MPPRTSPCAPLTNNKLPDGVTAYKRTPVFDQDNLPDAFEHAHQTKSGVWAIIHVLEGQLTYTTFSPHLDLILGPDTPGIVHPGQLHKVQPHGKVRFFVEFYRHEDSR